MVKSLNDIYEAIKKNPPKKVAVAAAEDLDIIYIANRAREKGIAEFILIGDRNRIIQISQENGIQLNAEIIQENDNSKAAELAVKMVKDGEANVIMKGLLHTGTFLKAVLNKEKGLNTGRLVSQISVFNKVCGEGIQFVTDCAMIIQPTLSQKKQLIENAVELAQKLGYENPKVAIVSALEVVNPEIPDTIDAAILSKMADRGQIKNAIVDGPFALDNALSQEAAKHKNIKGVVAGNADIMLMPNLQVGNVLAKSLTYFAKMNTASAVIGAGAPIVMTSRTETPDNKLLSIALASYIS